MPSRDHVINKELALAFGWTELETGNWCSPGGEVTALPPDYCKDRRRALNPLLMEMKTKEIAQAILAWKKGKKK